MFPNINSNIAKFALVALAYFITAKLGTMVPYKESIVTLIWLPTGIAVGTIMRFGNISLPAIFLAATLLELPLGVPLSTSAAIACTNTLAPFFAAYLLKTCKFNPTLVRQRDISLMIGVGLLSMLISATGGTFAIYLSGLIQQQELIRTWLIWWAGDSIGVMLALPLVLNINKVSMHLKRHQYYQLLICLMLFVSSELIISAFVTSVDKQFMLSIFLILPVLIWASMSSSIVGGSLVVIVLSSIVVWITARGYGSFYSENTEEGLLSLWMFMVTLVITMLLISMLQSKRVLAENALRNNEKKLRAVINGALDVS